MKKLKFLKLHWAKLLSIFFFILLLGAYAQIFAIAQPYQPGEILDPDCFPEEDNCTVDIGGGNSPITVVNTSNLFSTGLSGTGSGVMSATYSNFFGENAGYQAMGAHWSNFFGKNAGYQATTASSSNFFGSEAGSGATNAYGSNFFTYQSGYNATNADDSNFFGAQAGSGATRAAKSNFFSEIAGIGATDASYSNFFGPWSGSWAISASYSNFLGYRAGSGAANAPYSNFLGSNAGEYASNASYSNLFGYKTGSSFWTNVQNNIGSNNIIIGTNISLPNATANAMNLGGVLFATGTYGTTTGNPSITAVATGNVGIGVVTPSARLQLAAGTSSAGTAPLKLTAGTNLGTTEAGAIEYDGSHLYFTATNAGDRYQLDQQGGETLWAANGDDIYYNNGNVGIGTDSPTSKLDIKLDSTLSYEQTFSVNGLNDATYSGTYDGGHGGNIFYVIIYEYQRGTPDKFTYYDSYGDCVENDIPITGSAQSLCDGISITFGSTTGHNGGNWWRYQITSESTESNPAFKISDAIGSSYFTVNAVANNSNFLGTEAGSSATSAHDSNFFGFQAGNSATSAHDSNFFGYQAGTSATSSSSSNFFGYQAGVGATAPYSNFLGDTAGAGATAPYSNFLGYYAGYQATNASYSNLFGYNVGKNNLSDNDIGSNNIIIGTNISLPNATANAMNLGGVIFATGTYGTTTGNPSITAVSGGKVGIGVVSPSARLQLAAGTATAGTAPLKFTSGTNLTNPEAGTVEWDGTNLFITQTSGPTRKTIAYTTDIPAASPITVVNSSNLFSTGLTGTGSGVTAATYSNFFGVDAGNTATGANNSNFLGSQSGYHATSAYSSNFFGSRAGYYATSASSSNFLGDQAGANATSASSSNFLGGSAGWTATNAYYSNFFGYSAGQSAANASFSNFLGNQAGLSATFAHDSNFLGSQAGFQATNASNSNLFGYRAGYAFTNNNIGSNNIIIGTNISLPNATANAMNLGGVIFATDTYGTTTGDPSITPAASGKVGIGVVSPTARLEVQGLVTNASLGTEKVYNPNFDSNDSGWTATGWSWGSSKENYTGTTGAIDTVANGGIALNDRGRGYTNGDVLTLSNGANDATVTVSSVVGGIITGWTLSNSGTANTVSTSVSTTGGTGAGANFSINRLVDSANTLSQDVTVSNGNTYLVSYVVTRTAGELKLTLGGVTGHRVNASSTYSQVISATGTGNLIFTPTVDFSGSVDTVSVTQITPSSATTSLTNSNGSAGIELRSGGAGLGNTFIGLRSGYSNTTGYLNTANGLYSLHSNTAGPFNTASGSSSLFSNTTGSSNTASGLQSLFSNTTGNSNTASGMNSLYSNATGSGNTANGYTSLYSNTTGSYNTANGYTSLYSNTTGSTNTANGYLSLYSNTTGSSNTANGNQSLSFNTTGSGNTANGNYSLYNNTTGSNNTANGPYSLYSNATGSNNTANGNTSLYLNTTGSYNTANGYQSLFLNTTGSNNTANGSYSLNSNTTGGYNIANGNNSLFYNTIGNSNTANGPYSLYNSGKTLTAGSFITGILYTIITAGDTVWTDIGAANNNVGTVFTATGAGSGTGTAASNTNNNTALGYLAGRYAGSGSTANYASYNSLYLGYDTRAGADGNNNEIVIGYQTVGNGTNTATIGSTNVLYVGGSGITGKTARFTNSNGYCDINPLTDSLDCSSDITLKKNITDLNNTEFALRTIPDMTNATTLDKILSLTPVTFNWNTEDDTVSKHIGFIAQEMEQVFPELVQTDSITGLKTLSYTNLTPYLVKAIQEMDLKIKDLSSLDTTSATSLGSMIKSFVENEKNRFAKIFAKTVVTDSVEMKDSVTGESYCVTITNGELNRVKGKCEEQISEKTQTATAVAPVIPNATCSDGIMNQDETDIDKGGVCEPTIPSIVPITPETTTSPNDTLINTEGNATLPEDSNGGQTNITPDSTDNSSANEGANTNENIPEVTTPPENPSDNQTVETPIETTADTGNNTP